MTHVRTQIRERFAATLRVALPDYDVFASRKYNTNVTGRPLVDMRFLNENIAAQTMGNDRTRTASLYVRVQFPAIETGIDDKLDEAEVLIFGAIWAASWGDLLEEEPEMVQVNFSDSADGSVVIATLVLRFDLEYRVNNSDLETARA